MNVGANLPQVVDLFAGCGGLTAGFAGAGYPLRLAVEKWRPAAEVYAANFGTHPVCETDVAEEGVGGVAKLVENHVDGGSSLLIVGGPPCQDFSSAGNQVEGERSDLTVQFALIVGRVQPDYFVMENVERAKNSQSFRVALNVLGELYRTVTVVLNANRFGVPQTRSRLFVVGVRKDLPGVVEGEAFLRGGAERPLTVREYFVGEGLELPFEHYYRHPRNYARRGVFSVDEPSATIRGINRPYPPGYTPHPGDTTTLGETPGLRALTSRERMHVQTFPPGFVIPGNVTKTATDQMVGNAVPVKLGLHVAVTLRDVLLG